MRAFNKQQKAMRFRRTGVMRGTEAARVRGIASAWDPERAAKRASERSTRSGLHDRGDGIPGEHERLAAKMRENGVNVTASDLDNEAYKDVRYRSHDKVCPVCRAEVPPRASLGGNREIQSPKTIALEIPSHQLSLSHRAKLGTT